MAMNNPVANALSKIMNAEKIGRRDCLVRPVSKLIGNVLDVMKNEGFIGDIEEIEDGRGNMLKVNLLGNINKCGPITPTFNVKLDSYERFEKRYLPAKDFGIMIVSTPLGIMAHKDSKNKKVGGKLLAYCY
ncbi:30S ribosomal protein S8 [Candidatus Woesearchaeota archaeon]|nr:30S ribosomal protein S8 [Candidatus Woesearchaeota archaeon]